VRIRSTGATATELAAGFALATGQQGVRTLVEPRLGDPGTGDELDLDVKTLRGLAALVTEIDVAVVATQLTPDAAHVDELLELPWSVVVATPSAESRNTQWS
jgi:hypothetical protein